MLNFLGITRHLSTTAGYAKRIGWLLHEDVTQSPFPVTGVSFTGTVKTEQGDLPIAITHGEQENYLELTFPALPIGRWPYAIHAQDESGEDLRLFAGYIGAVESVPPIEASTVYDIPVMGIAIPIEAGKTIKAQWLSNTAASLAAQQAHQDASSTRTDADTASQAATTATGAATTAAERAREAEGYADSAYVSKVAASNSETAANTSAADAARDARSANDAKTAVEGIVSDFTQTVSSAEQTISAAKEEAVIVIQAKQADSVLAVGRAQKTATDKVASAQGAAVTAVETAKTEAVQTVQTAQAEAMEAITPLVERTEAAKGEIDHAEGRIKTAETNAATSAKNASDSATAAQQALAAIPQVDAAGNMTLAGGLTATGTVTANGGVRVPLPATAQEAISYEALIEQRAADDWRRMGYYMETLIPSWVTTIVRQMQMSAAYNVGTANVSIKEGVYGNDWQDMLVTMTKAAGVSLIGCSTGAWKFANYMGNSRNRDYAAASVWRIIGSDKVSILLGSTAQGYSSATNPAADCYAHPIHWVDYAWDNANYRYPLINSVNGATSRDMTPAWQVTIYPKGYLGSSTSCLLRGTDYGRDVGDQQYMWALAPSVTYLSVAITHRQSADHANVENRWEMFVDGHYVMPMTSLFCGSGNTACITAKAKAHEVSSTYQVGLRMGGMRIDTAPALGVTDVWPIMERVVMRDATVKPVPDVTASALEVPAAGGEVTLTVSSTLAEAIYVINDTMCGHDPAAVWCSQSAEQIPAGGGQVVLTLTPNTTGQPRQAWAFVGHHYAQTAVVEINQLAQ